MTRPDKLTRSEAKIVITTVEPDDEEEPRTYRANLRHRDDTSDPENLQPCRHSKGHETNADAVACGEAMWGKLK